MLFDDRRHYIRVYANPIRYNANEALKMVSGLQTCSTIISEDGNYSSITRPQALDRSGMDVAKGTDSDDITSRVDQKWQSQVEVMSDVENAGAAVLDGEKEKSSSMRNSEPVHLNASWETVSSVGSTKLELVTDSSKPNQTSSHVTAHVDSSSRTDGTALSLPDQQTTVREQGHDHVDPVSDPSIHKGSLSGSAPAPRWRTSFAYEADSMDSLGKNRYLIRQMPVPAEAETRFAAVKETLEADIRRLVAGMKIKAQILWSYKLCMVGVRSGGLIDADPMILISCGSLRGKRKIKESLLRIRPHYLERLGMSLIVRYDKSAPVLASEDEDWYQPPSLKRQSNGEEVATYLPEEKLASITRSCGMRITFKHDSLEKGVQRTYATLGGIIGLGGDCYGLTTAHPILGLRTKKRTARIPSNSSSASASSACSDSSDDRGAQSSGSHARKDLFMSKSLLAPPEEMLTHQAQNLVRLPDGSCLAYSFNGECKSPSWSVRTAAAVSDWAILQIPESHIRPNVYRTSLQEFEQKPGQQIYITSIASPHLMKSGHVHVLCDAKASRIGYLSMNIVSLQLEGGALDVLEVFLKEPMHRGTSGSWVVREQRLVGILVALGTGGNSCLIIPAWKVFADIVSVCRQEVQLTAT